MNIKWIKNRIKKESVFFIFLVISLLAHISSYLNLKNLTSLWDSKDNLNKPFQVNVDESHEVQKLVEEAKKLYEARKEPGDKPKKADHLGFQDHTAKKEQRVDTRYSSPLLDASSSVSGPQDNNISNQNEEDENNFLKEQVIPEGKNKKRTKQLGSLYKKFMPQLNDGSSIPISKKAHFDELSSDLELGEYTDVNTLEYKNMGYFVGMRKAVESVWIYPSDAKRYGYQGVVGIRFSLQKDGSVTDARVLKSSGYKSLDVYALRALNEASFLPPPEEVYKKSPFYWTFRYEIY